MSYFSTDTPSRGSLIVARGRDLKRITPSAGVHLHPLIGERLNVNVVVIDPDATAEIHTHDEEQMGYIVSGSVTFTDGDGSWGLQPGDTYHAPPGCPHGATAGPEGCTIIDVFSPVRAGLRELLDAAE